MARLSAESPQEARVAWNDLVTHYHAPLMARTRRLLTRLRGRPATAEDAEEHLQAFWLACVERDWLARADHLRGRFRAFVQVVLKRFLRDRVEHEHAAKRHPVQGRAIVSLSEPAACAADSVAEAEDAVAFDREWVSVALERAIAKVEATGARDGVVLRDLIRTDGKGSPDLAALLRVHARQLAVIRTRVRDRFAKHFAAELAATVRDPSDLDEEWKALAPYLP